MQPLMRALRSGRRRRAGGLCPVLAGTLLLSVLAVTPAVANHQNCGANYPTGTLPNGHPDLDATLFTSGWAGQPHLHDLQAVLTSLDTTKTLLGHAADAADAFGDHLLVKSTEDTLPAGWMTNSINVSQPLTGGTGIYGIPFGGAGEIKINFQTNRAGHDVAKWVAWGLNLAAFVVHTAEVPLKIVTDERTSDVGSEDFCNTVLMGNMVDNAWVLFVEEQLASTSPPLAILTLPSGEHAQQWPLLPQHTDADFPWCESAGLSAHDVSCVATYHDGFLDAPVVGVRDIVRNTIDHAVAHGLGVRHAETFFADADQARADAQFREAFQHYRAAYQEVTHVDG